MKENSVLFGECNSEYGFIMNNLNSEIVFCKKDILKVIKNNEELLDYIEAKLKLNLSNKEDVTGVLENQASLNGNKVSLVRVMMTDVCNANCEYCKVVPNVLNKRQDPVTIDGFKYALDLLLKSDYVGPKIVHITGG